MLSEQEKSEDLHPLVFLCSQRLNLFLQYKFNVTPPAEDIAHFLPYLNSKMRWYAISSSSPMARIFQINAEILLRRVRGSASNLPEALRIRMVSRNSGTAF